ncbi:MAG: 3'-5' exoribonuclease YhaM family protein [Desulfobulbales bacterium]|nr:3'-5' exoribonuclease YhaM family protein [Desulfobulbales bacterium]
MTTEKKIFVNQLQEGQSVADIFLVKDMSRAETRSGSPYLMLTLMDRSGEIAGRLWENADAFLDVCAPGNLVQINGQAQAYRGSLQLKVDMARQVDEKETDIGLFLQSSAKNIGAMAGEITSLAETVQDPFYRQLLRKLLRDSSFAADFHRAPAAKSMHHAYLGGLLEHTLAVTQLAAMVCSFYPHLDRDLLLAGALLHDIGKTRELSFQAYPFDYTDRGRLVGHLVLGVEIIQDAVNAIPDFPPDHFTRLQHLILSHHGRHEFGSPTLPMFSEAFVLNFIDDLDAKLNYLARLETQAPEPGYQWTDFQRTLERFIYIKGRPQIEEGDSAADPDEDKEDGGETNSRQQHLF